MGGGVKGIVYPPPVKKHIYLLQKCLVGLAKGSVKNNDDDIHK